MKTLHAIQDRSATTSRPASGGELNQNRVSFQHEKNQRTASFQTKDEDRNGESANNQSRNPTAEEIAERAYAIFLEQGAVHGHDLEHWYNAESELVAERNHTQEHSAPRR